MSFGLFKSTVLIEKDSYNRIIYNSNCSFHKRIKKIEERRFYPTKNLLRCSNSRVYFRATTVKIIKWTSFDVYNYLYINIIIVINGF